MQQSPSWEANSSLARKGNPHILRNPNVRYQSYVFSTPTNRTYINYLLFSYMFRRLLRHLQAELFCVSSKILLHFVIT